MIRPICRRYNTFHKQNHEKRSANRPRVSLKIKFLVNQRIIMRQIYQKVKPQPLNKTGNFIKGRKWERFSSFSCILLSFSEVVQLHTVLVNPLSANVGYIRHDTSPWSLRTVTPDAVKILKTFCHFRVRAWNFLQNGIQNFSWEIALQSQIFVQKKSLALRSLVKSSF